MGAAGGWAAGLPADRRGRAAEQQEEACLAEEVGHGECRDGGGQSEQARLGGQGIEDCSGEERRDLVVACLVARDEDERLLARHPQPERAGAARQGTEEGVEGLQDLRGLVGEHPSRPYSLSSEIPLFFIVSQRHASRKFPVSGGILFQLL